MHPLVLSAALGLTLSAGVGQAQTTEPEAPGLPSMAAIEQAHAAGDLVTVREGLERLATETGTPLAQFRYGQALLEGIGGPRDSAAAMDWLQRAVDQDHLHAATMLARMLLTGDPIGIERDPVRAATLLTRSASRGDAEAQYYLGLLYRAGTGVAQNLETAFNWLLAAAEQQHVPAQYELSRAYSRGEGTPLDTAKALRWLQAAATNGHVEAQFFLANALDNGAGVPQDTAEALRWYRRAAEAGYVLAQRILGTRYLLGDGVEQNGEEALRWLIPAAQAGDPGAAANLGYAYLNGEGIAPDPVQAARWYRHAVERHELPRAMTALAELYQNGQGVEQDLSRAVLLYRQAAAAGDAVAPRILGRLAAANTLDGIVAPQRAVPWVLAAAEAGHAPALDWLRAHAEGGMRSAQAHLGRHLLDQGDTAAALPLLTAAARAGDVPTQATLGQLYATGNGVDLDYVAAYTWLNIAAAQASVEAHEHREVIVQLMTPGQIADGQDATRRFFEEAADPQVTR